MGGGTPKVDTSAQKAQLAMQKEQLQKEREEAKRERVAISKATTKELRAKRRGSRGRSSLIGTSERGVVSEEEQAELSEVLEARAEKRSAEMAELPEKERQRVVARQAAIRRLFGRGATSNASIVGSRSSLLAEGSEVEDEAFVRAGGRQVTKADAAFAQQFAPKAKKSPRTFAQNSGPTGGIRSEIRRISDPLGSHKSTRSAIKKAFGF